MYHRSLQQQKLPSQSPGLRALPPPQLNRQRQRQMDQNSRPPLSVPQQHRQEYRMVQWAKKNPKRRWGRQAARAPRASQNQPQSLLQSTQKASQQRSRTSFRKDQRPLRRLQRSARSLKRRPKERRTRSRRRLPLGLPPTPSLLDPLRLNDPRPSNRLQQLQALSSQRSSRRLALSSFPRA